jgi:hypothetical protein
VLPYRAITNVAGSVDASVALTMIGIGAGLALGYFAWLLIAHERWDFLAVSRTKAVAPASKSVLDAERSSQTGCYRRA